MASTTVAEKSRRAWTTTVFIKQMMAVTGLVFVVFLLFHSYGNLKMFLGAESYNHYAHWLKEDMLYPILPHGMFIWIFRGALLLFLILHIWSAAITWKRSRRARRKRYVVKKSVANAYAARTMRVTGLIVFLGIILHILHFTTGTIKTNFTAADEPYTRMVNSFGLWYMVLFYVIFVGAVCIHVAHGFWSAFQSMGFVRAGTRRFMVVLSALVAGVIFIMFLAPPVAIAFGLIS